MRGRIRSPLCLLPDELPDDDDPEGLGSWPYDPGPPFESEGKVVVRM
nr:hypothetical protein OG999_34520 [Streptomyces sp. NBC_00886]